MGVAPGVTAPLKGDRCLWGLAVIS